MKTFDELYNLDITDKVKKNKDGLDYLNWLDLYLTLRSLGMNPIYGVSKVKEMKVSGQIIVTVWVKIGDYRCEITYTDARSRDFEFIKQRAFVKCVAIHLGLGLKLWEKTEADPSPVDDVSVKSKARDMTMLFSEKVQKHGSPQAVHELLGTTQKLLAGIVESGTSEEIEMMSKMIAKI